MNIKYLQTEMIFNHNFIIQDCYIGKTEEKTSYCELNTKRIYLSSNDWDNPTNETLFSLLHEIGHIKTNTKGMKRCEEEFYATMWAIKELKKLGLSISNKRQKEYQTYIYKSSIIKAMKKFFSYELQYNYFRRHC